MKRKEEADAKEAAEGVNLDFELSEYDQFESLARKLVAVPKKELDEKRKDES